VHTLKTSTKLVCKSTSSNGLLNRSQTSTFQPGAFLFAAVVIHTFLFTAANVYLNPWHKGHNTFFISLHFASWWIETGSTMRRNTFRILASVLHSDEGDMVIPRGEWRDVRSRSKGFHHNLCMQLLLHWNETQSLNSFRLNLCASPSKKNLCCEPIFMVDNY
jgi:hypothetical protein